MNRIKFHGRSSAREGKTILLKAALALVLSAQLFNTGFVAEAGGELSINSPANGATVDQQSITLSGVGGPNSYIQQVVDGSVVAETMTDVNGNWELTGVGLVCGVDNQITLENSILPEASSFDQNVFSDWSVTLANGNMVNIGVDRRYIEVYQDLAATQPMATLDLGVDSEAASLVQYGDYIYVATSINNASLETVINKINVSDPSNLYLEDTFPLNTGAPFTVGMTSIVINQDGTTLFVGPDNYQVTAVNTTDGSITANYSPIGNGGSSFMSLDISDSGQYLYVYIYDYSSGNLNFTSVDISGFLGGADGDMSAYGYYDIPMDQYASWSSESGYNYHIVYAQGDPSRLYISNLGITGWIDLNPTNEGMFDNVVEYQFTLLDSADLMVKADCDNDVISQVKVLPNTGSDNGLFAQIAIVSLGLLLVAGLRVYKRVGITKSQIYLLVTTKT